jgi:tRNA-dihydrouridine synthase A
MTAINRRFSIAPMMDWTDKNCRYFHRLLSKNALLYTEMVTTGALLHGDHHRFLAFNPEVNLNVGCPSDRVQNGRFGACLMLEPDLVADCVAAMRNSVSIPVTVKTRIGVDDRDAYSDLAYFVSKVADAGCSSFIIHARKAWLSGLSPKQNREVPPLRYDTVFQLKRDFPLLEIVINGGITSLTREAYQNPYMLADVDRLIFSTPELPKSRGDVIELLIPYIEQQLCNDKRLNSVTRHILGIFHGEPGAKGWRRHLSENATRPEAGINVLMDALAFTRH